MFFCALVLVFFFWKALESNPNLVVSANLYKLRRLNAIDSTASSILIHVLSPKKKSLEQTISILKEH